jgi:hypothetical protein
MAWRAGSDRLVLPVSRGLRGLPRRAEMEVLRVPSQPLRKLLVWPLVLVRATHPRHPCPAWGRSQVALATQLECLRLAWRRPRRGSAAQLQCLRPAWRASLPALAARLECLRLAWGLSLLASAAQLACLRLAWRPSLLALAVQLECLGLACWPSLLGPAARMVSRVTPLLGSPAVSGTHLQSTLLRPSRLAGRSVLVTALRRCHRLARGWRAASVAPLAAARRWLRLWALPLQLGGLLVQLLGRLLHGLQEMVQRLALEGRLSKPRVRPRVSAIWRPARALLVRLPAPAMRLRLAQPSGCGSRSGRPTVPGSRSANHRTQQRRTVQRLVSAMRTLVSRIPSRSCRCTGAGAVWCSRGVVHSLVAIPDGW